MTDLKADIYGDHEVVEYSNTPFPRWLKWVYILTPIWGILWFVFFWDGSSGVLDPGRWTELEEAARTTAPFERVEGPDPAENSPYIQPIT